MPLIDPIQLDQMTAGDDELLADLSVMFVKLLPEIESRVRLGLINGDAGSIKSAAHQLKSRVSYFGATTVRNRVQYLESMAVNNTPEYLSPIADAIFDDIDRLIVELSVLTGLALERDAK